VNIAADSISILSNDGGGLTAPVTLPANDEPRYIAARDYDADGDIDLAVVHKRSNDLWLYRNDGTGGFTQALEDRFALNDAPHAVDAADLDLDGDCDLVVSHVGSDPFVRLMLNDGTGKFEPEVLFSPDGGAHVVAVDLDGDSDFDVATANTNNGTVNIHRNETVDAGGIMFLALVDQAGGPFEPGQEIEVELRMRDLAGQPVVAYQAFLEFTTTQLAFVEGVYTVEPMGLGIIDPIEAIGGKIDLAAGLLPGKQEPTTEDAALAVLTFRALSALCDPSVRFRPNTPPTRLSGVDGAPVEPLLLINLGSQSCPADINGDCDVGFADLLSMLTAWGPCEECPQDLDRSGDVGITDLLRVLASWGPCAA
ncbi:MAG: cohesin domain-containing protein, partial [Phycisphaerae bacterium]|nr:cohesin domain-containing protein [Phycisphaerae bacterium]